MAETSIMRDGVAALATAAAVLIEDAHPQLLSASVQLADQAASLHSLGADLAVLGAAAAILARHEAQGAVRAELDG